MATTGNHLGPSTSRSELSTTGNHFPTSDFGSKSGRRNLFLRSRIHNLEYYNSDQQLNSESMGTNTMFPEVDKNLYSEIEPYDTGFLKVSDIHSIYYEQSGNPDGNVSFRCLSTLKCLCIVCINS
ncbi:hypothetical protein BUALT_Bualt15G0059700 [Buddleja alternifolia]|uniref:Uncharacterized protein n=1 Tax=Buddleja alternifolia TaxID=168488 RepID=A0AAV6WER6_9LAMI|nr:hypothetical protein BUALT_Bualt15G0059700 [Buddleja alternifolia]